MSIDHDRWRRGGQTVTLEQWRQQVRPIPAPPARGSRLTERVDVPDDWRLSRRCVDKDTNFFFPGEGDSRQFVEIRRFCAPCPVAAECEQYAVETETWAGWFGGKSARERSRERVRRPKDRTHGTVQMYRFGPFGEDPTLGCKCEVCATAYRKAHKQWNKRRGIEK